MEENKRLSEIDDYLHGKMTAGDKQAFEKKIETDVQLKKDVATQEELIEGIKAYRRKEDFMKMMGGIHEKYEQSIEKKTETKVVTINKKRNWLKPLLAVAAAVTLIIIAFDWWSTSPDFSQFAQANFMPYKDILTEQITASGAASDPNKAYFSQLEQGIAAYKQKDYINAQKKFTTFKNNASTRNLLVVLTDFYLAQLALDNLNYTEAIKLLEPISTIGGLPFAAEINWYLALAYLGENQPEKARGYLIKIPQNSEFSSKAKEMLLKL